MNELYEKAARAALENCLALLDESKILVEHSKPTRAYALCALAAEEFCKSFVYKAVSAGIVDESRANRIIKSHVEKISDFIHIILTQCLFALNSAELHKAMEHDGNEPDHDKHTFPSVMANANKEFGRWVPTITSVISCSHSKKLSALYVDLDIENQKVLSPNDAIGSEDIKWLSWFLNTFLPGFEIILGETDAQFGRVAEFIDPAYGYILRPTKN